MNSLKVLVWTLLIGMMALSSAVAQEKGTLVVNANAFKTDKGFAIVNIFRENDDIPKKYFRQAKAEIRNGKAILPFPDLPFGNYAAILFQDANANGILDHRFGPNEPMGFSNDWELTLFSGMPTFNKLKFQFTADRQELNMIISRD